jgi:N-acetylmuramoyl-L-alanine amidase
MIALTNRFCQQNKRKGVDILVLFFIYFLLLPQNLFSTDPQVRNKVQVVVIDAGHGGKDPGALGSKIMEKDVVLSISLKLGKYIEENFDDVEVIYTRNTDVFIPLDERAEIANKAKADLFISIHANALPNSPALGTETFVMGVNKDSRNFEVAKKENSVILLEDNYETKYQGFDPNSIDSYIIFSVMQKTYQGHSLAFASMIQDEFEHKAKRINRGVKQDGFWVLWRTTMPSVLVETGFLTNPEEEKFLASNQGQDYLASAMFRAFRKYKNAIEQNSNFDSYNDSRKEVSSLNELAENIESNAKNEVPEDIYFKVQVLVSGKQIEDPDTHFSEYSDIKEFRTGKWYKYSVGKSYSYDEIEEYCKKVRLEYPDAFIVGIKNGEIINVKKALQEINK